MAGHKSCRFSKSVRWTSRRSRRRRRARFLPTTDIFETGDALTVVLEMPGVSRNNINVSVENGVLTIEGKINFDKYEGLQPVYSEYNIGPHRRAFGFRAGSIRTRSEPR